MEALGVPNQRLGKAENNQGGCGVCPFPKRMQKSKNKIQGRDGGLELELIISMKFTGRIGSLVLGKERFLWNQKQN